MSLTAHPGEAAGVGCNARHTTLIPSDSNEKLQIRLHPH